jgi:hypothetical protein
MASGVTRWPDGPHGIGDTIMGRLIRRVLGIALLGSIASGIAAFVAKRHLVSIGEPGDDEIALVSIFDQLQFASTADAFRGGSVVLWYAGGEIDLRGATLDPAGARLTARILFGGVQLIVPDDWQVELQLVGILGGVGDARTTMGRPADGPRLVIDGFAAFGGMGITSSSRNLEVDA